MEMVLTMGNILLTTHKEVAGQKQAAKCFGHGKSLKA
jgi:hypothetical protein